MKALQVHRGGAVLRYHDLPGRGDPLVIVHGLGCASSFDYPPVAAHPALAHRRRILVDLPGHGYSDAPRHYDYTVEVYAAGLCDLVRDLGVTTVDLFGHSLGGSVAIAASRTLGPRVGRLVVGEPNLMPGGGSFSRRIASSDERSYIAGGHADLVEEVRAAGDLHWSATLAIASPLAVHRAASSLVAGSEPTWGTMLRDLTMPRAVLTGALSPPEPAFDRLHAEGIRVVEVPGAGHSMACDNPTGLAEAIAAALP